MPAVPAGLQGMDVPAPADRAQPTPAEAALISSFYRKLQGVAPIVAYRNVRFTVVCRAAAAPGIVSPGEMAAWRAYVDQVEYAALYAPLAKRVSIALHDELVLLLVGYSSLLFILHP